MCPSRVDSLQELVGLTWIMSRLVWIAPVERMGRGGIRGFEVPGKSDHKHGSFSTRTHRIDLDLHVSRPVCLVVQELVGLTWIMSRPVWLVPLERFGKGVRKRV